MKRRAGSGDHQRSGQESYDQAGAQSTTALMEDMKSLFDYTNGPVLRVRAPPTLHIRVTYCPALFPRAPMSPRFAVSGDHCGLHFREEASARRRGRRSPGCELGSSPRAVVGSPGPCLPWPDGMVPAEFAPTSEPAPPRKHPGVFVPRAEAAL